MDVFLIADWVKSYWIRCFPDDSKTVLSSVSNVIGGVFTWQDALDPALKHASAMNGNPGRFWKLVKDTTKGLASNSETKVMIYGLYLMAERLFYIPPNAATQNASLVRLDHSSHRNELGSTLA